MFSLPWQPYFVNYIPQNFYVLIECTCYRVYRFKKRKAMCVVYFYFILFIYFNNHFLIAYIYNYIYNNTRKKSTEKE